MRSELLFLSKDTVILGLDFRQAYIYKQSHRVKIPKSTKMGRDWAMHSVPKCLQLLPPACGRNDIWGTDERKNFDEPNEWAITHEITLDRLYCENTVE